jgi:hypothetical protein
LEPIDYRRAEVPAVPELDLSAEAAEALIDLDVLGIEPSPEHKRILIDRSLITWYDNRTRSGEILVDHLLADVYREVGA